MTFKLPATRGRNQIPTVFTLDLPLQAGGGGEYKRVAYEREQWSMEDWEKVLVKSSLKEKI